MVREMQHACALRCCASLAGGWWHRRNTIRVNSARYGVRDTRSAASVHGGAVQKGARVRNAFELIDSVSNHCRCISCGCVERTATTTGSSMCCVVWRQEIHSTYSMCTSSSRNTSTNSTCAQQCWCAVVLNRSQWLILLQYICERHFRAESGRSMFTNLRAVNHFGRPNLPGFLRYVGQKHPLVSVHLLTLPHVYYYAQEKTIGVFSCGPSALNSDVARACRRANTGTEGAQFIHRYETF